MTSLAGGFRVACLYRKRITNRSWVIESWKIHELQARRRAARLTAPAIPAQNYLSRTGQRCRRLPPSRNRRKWIDPGAEPTADCAMADDRTTQRWWGVDLLATLISHRRRSLAFPITTLSAPVKLSSSFALLVPAVGGAPLPPPDSLTARWAAVPLTTVAIRTNGEHGPTLRGATGSHSENRHHLARYPAPQFFVQSGLAQIRMVGERQRFQPHMTAFQCHRLYTHPFILQTVHICEACLARPSRTL